MEEIFEMSEGELDRFRVLSAVQAKELSQMKAAQILGITDRQVRNLLRALENEGAKALQSKKERQSE